MSTQDPTEWVDTLIMLAMALLLGIVVNILLSAG